MSDKALRTALIRLASEKPHLRKDLLPLLKKEASERSRRSSIRTARVDMKMADDLVTDVGNELEKALKAAKSATNMLTTWDRVAPLLEDWVTPSDIGSRRDKPHRYWLLLQTALDEDVIPVLKKALEKTYYDFTGAWDDGQKHMDPKTGEPVLYKHQRPWRSGDRRMDW